MRCIQRALKNTNCVVRTPENAVTTEKCSLRKENKNAQWILTIIIDEYILLNGALPTMCHYNILLQ